MLGLDAPDAMGGTGCPAVVEEEVQVLGKWFCLPHRKQMNGLRCFFFGGSDVLAEWSFGAGHFTEPDKVAKPVIHSMGGETAMAVKRFTLKEP